MVSPTIVMTYSLEEGGYSVREVGRQAKSVLLTALSAKTLIGKYLAASGVLRSRVSLKTIEKTLASVLSEFIAANLIAVNEDEDLIDAGLLFTSEHKPYEDSSSSNSSNSDDNISSTASLEDNSESILSFTFIEREKELYILTAIDNLLDLILDASLPSSKDTSAFKITLPSIEAID